MEPHERAKVKRAQTKQCSIIFALVTECSPWHRRAAAADLCPEPAGSLGAPGGPPPWWLLAASSPTLPCLASGPGPPSPLAHISSPWSPCLAALRRTFCLPEHIGNELHLVILNVPGLLQFDTNMIEILNRWLKMMQQKMQHSVVTSQVWCNAAGVKQSNNGKRGNPAVKTDKKMNS